MNAIVLMAAGSGQRMKNPLPKVFLQIADAPLLVHAFRNAQAHNPSALIVVVLSPAYIQHWQSLQEAFGLPAHCVVAGGSERFFSVKNALDFLEKEYPHLENIAIHDGVRCLTTAQTWQKGFLDARTKNCAIASIDCVDSLLKIDPLTCPVPRAQYRQVQTPQFFDFGKLLAAYRQPYQAAFTDDASVFYAAGHPLHWIEGDPCNIKPTYPIDLLFLQQIFIQKKQV